MNANWSYYYGTVVMPPDFYAVITHVALEPFSEEEIAELEGYGVSRIEIEQLHRLMGVDTVNKAE